ncbi:MAG: SUKH-3 domain-containing protein [Actinomycetaceae bacterium]|nr:SUKH-3 domain-containing protein [Actinomycetaceae bacterium]
MGIKISSTHVERLRCSGWHQQRHVDIAGYEALFADAGYPLKPAAREFLESFVGLTIPIPDYQSTSGHQEFIVDPEIAVRNIPAPRSDYEECAGAVLTPIGVAYGEQLTLFIAAWPRAGAVFGGFESSFSLIGDSFDEALTTIFSGKAFTRLQE